MAAAVGLLVFPLIQGYQLGWSPVAYAMVAASAPASGIANAVQQVGSALGIAVIGAVFFGQLTAAVGYGHAFAATAAVQVALLATAGALTLFLPRRIAADAYRQQ